MRRFHVPVPKGNPFTYTYEDIYSEYWEVIRDYVYSTTEDFHKAEDVAQETMLQVLKRMDWIKRDRLAPAISVITNSVIIDLYRAEKGMSQLTYFEDELTFECSDEGISDPINELVFKESITTIDRICKGLPEGYLQLFKDFYIEGLSVDDICERDKVTRGAVYIRLHRLRKSFVDQAADIYGADL